MAFPLAKSSIPTLPLVRTSGLTRLMKLREWIRDDWLTRICCMASISRILRNFCPSAPPPYKYATCRGGSSPRTQRIWYACQYGKASSCRHCSPGVSSWVGGEVCIRRLAAHRHLQRIVAAKLVAIVGILIAAENLAYALAHHLHVSMMDEFLLTRVGNELP